MKLGFKKFINIFLMLFIFTYVINCAEEKKNDENINSEIEKSPDSLISDIDPAKRKFDETQEEYQTRLAGKYNVRKKTTINYLYDLNGNLMPEGAVSEEIEFDKNGRRIEQIIYRSFNQINYKWNFKYDENNNMTEFISYDKSDVMQLKKILTYDQNNNLIATKEFYPSKGNEINYEYKYDDKGNLIETVGTTSDGKKSSEKREYFDFGKTKKIEMFDQNGNKTAEKKFSYDNKGNLIKEVIKYPNNTEQEIIYSNYDYIYPKEIQHLIQKKIYEYDENGNALIDIMFNSDGGRQHKFINEYDKRGLIIKKTRYDALDKPKLILEYQYEYYK